MSGFEGREHRYELDIASGEMKLVEISPGCTCGDCEQLAAEMARAEEEPTR